VPAGAARRLQAAAAPPIPQSPWRWPHGAAASLIAFHTRAAE
jgi:hypothetical protein